MKITAEDFAQLTGRIQMDLRDAQTRLTELRAWIAALDLPTEERPFNEEVGRMFVFNVGWEYTDESLAEELRQRGAPEAFVGEALLLAQELREAREARA